MVVSKLLISVLVLSSAVSVSWAQEIAGPKFDLTPHDFVMTTAETSRFVNEVVNPLWINCAENPNCEVPGLQTRIRRLFFDINSAKLEYSIVPAYHPDRKNRSAFKIELSNGPRPQLVLFAAELRDLQKQLSADQFRYEVFVTMAHEEIHLEQLNEYSIETLEGIAVEEASAWGKTVLEIIRPLLSAGKHLPQGQVNLSDRLRKLHDDYHNPEWVKIFRVAKVNGASQS